MNFGSQSRKANTFRPFHMKPVLADEDRLRVFSRRPERSRPQNSSTHGLTRVLSKKCSTGTVQPDASISCQILEKSANWGEYGPRLPSPACFTYFQNPLGPARALIGRDQARKPRRQRLKKSLCGPRR